jgi:hypothetical protein
MEGSTPDGPVLVSGSYTCFINRINIETRRYKKNDKDMVPITATVTIIKVLNFDYFYLVTLFFFDSLTIIVGISLIGMLPFIGLTCKWC